MEFNNGTSHEFTDISCEISRTYHFGDNQSVTVTAPRKLSVSESGGHRVWDAAGESHYVNAGWLSISWRTKSGHPHFVK